MDFTEMLKRFQIFASENLFAPQNNNQEEVSRVLLEYDWVRIVLSRNPLRPNEMGIEVEVAFPHPERESKTLRMTDLFDMMITHLEYLKRLAMAGFNIIILHDEGLLIASIVLQVEASAEITAILYPPNGVL